jgi:hypothetical protein
MLAHGGTVSHRIASTGTLHPWNPWLRRWERTPVGFGRRRPR